MLFIWFEKMMKKCCLQVLFISVLCYSVESCGIATHTEIGKIQVVVGFFVVA
jgi:hypothetical protein